MSSSEREGSWTPPPISDVWVNEELLDADVLVPEIEQEALKKTLEVFERIEIEYENGILRDAYEVFKNSLRSPICRKEYKIIGDFLPRTISCSTFYSSTKEKKRIKPVTIVIETSKGPKIQQCTPKIIFGSPILPRMKYWVHMEKNHEGPDNLRLSHIPHIADELDDREFVTDLRDMYSEGIHGADRGCEKYINDYMMYLLIKEMHEIWESEKFYIYIAIFKLFPNKYTFTQFQEGVFLTLMERFENFNVNVPPHSMELASTLFCEECLEYDCLLHVTESQSRLVLQQPNIVDGVEPEEPCSPSCYKLCIETNESATINFYDNSLMDTFRILLSAKKHVICKVALIMNKFCVEQATCTKTCSEWFQISTTLRNESNNNNNTNNIYNNPDMNNINNGNSEHNTNLESSKLKRNLFKSAAQRRDHYKTFCKNRTKVEYPSKMNPCNHAGKCESSPDCECYKNGLACFKHCSCDIDCVIKMPGCSCAPGCCSSTCCWCLKASFECDPDICLSCNCDLADPKPGATTCKNIGIQIGLKKDIEIGVSQISGWGCFIRGTASKGDLISEYTGEVVSQSEGERRGRIYDKASLSYVFDLNLDESVDAGRFGNLIRFANHSQSKPNCETLIKIVSGRQRIGIYAKRNINDREELVFDYGYKDENKQLVPIEIDDVAPKKSKSKAKKKVVNRKSERKKVRKNR